MKHEPSDADAAGARFRWGDSLDATDEIDFARRLAVEFCKVDGWKWTKGSR